MLVHSNLSEKIKLKHDDEEFIILEEVMTFREVIADIIFIILSLALFILALDGKNLKPCRYCNETDNGLFIFHINIIFYIILPVLMAIFVYDLFKKRKITFDKKSKVIIEENFPIKSARVAEFYSVQSVNILYRTLTGGKTGFREFYAVSILFDNSHIDIGYFSDYRDAEFYAQRISEYISKPITDGKQIKISDNVREKGRKEKAIGKILRIFFVGPQNKEEGSFARKMIIVWVTLLLIIAFIAFITL